jgi:hypothetical protein
VIPHRLAALGAIVALALPVTAMGQEEGTAPSVLEVGRPAPDFRITGATRFGVLRDPVHLSDFRGKTVVLAFFFRVRTKG